MYGISSKRSDETTDETVNCLGSLSLQFDLSGYSHLNFSFHRIIYFFKANNCMDQVLRALAERLRGYILCNAQALESKFTTKEKTNVKSNSVQDHERLVNIRIKPSRILKGWLVRNELSRVTLFVCFLPSKNSTLGKIWASLMSKLKKDDAYL